MERPKSRLEVTERVTELKEQWKSPNLSIRQKNHFKKINKKKKKLKHLTLIGFQFYVIQVLDWKKKEILKST